ncbi:MAG TPA: RDD family protein [Longimicrobiaceae bacterium]|nr:RDD family protein [Longimicrobiaceae bacterium]
MPPTDPRVDARRIITQEAFSVAPHLLGLPLARPSRRLVAILLDLLLVAILANLGGAVLLGLAAGVAFFVFAARKLGKGGSFFGKTARFAFRGTGALILMGVTCSVWDRAGDAVNGDGDETPVARAGMSVAAGGAEPVKASPMGAVRMVKGLMELQGAGDSAAAAAAAQRVVAEMRTMRMSDTEIRDALANAASESGKDWMPAALAGAVPADSTAQPLSEDSLAVLYAAAVAASDSAGVDSLRPRLASSLARDSLAGLRGELSEAESDRAELRERLEEEENRGLLSSLLGFLNDLGIGFGWNALYFTACLAFFKGQTIAKRLLGIRVVRLNGQPITLWTSFERFGGYAAGLLTGLLGFAQVYWDRNRQAIHDKISETVVIREARGVPVPPPPPAPRWTPPAPRPAAP